MHYPKDSVTENIISLPWRKGKNILVFGGSQGADSINQKIISFKKLFYKETINILHITGKRYFSNTFSEKSPIIEYADNEQVMYVTLDYVENMALLYNWSDIVISRAGATSVAELLHYQKAALLVPYPRTTDNHQDYNADELVKSGLAKKVTVDDISADLLLSFINKSFEQKEDHIKFHDEFL